MSFGIKMKSTLCALLAVTLLASPIGAFATTPKIRTATSSETITQIRLGQELVSLEQFRVILDEVTYSLQNLEETLEDLKTNQAHAALAGISRNVAIDIKERFEAGLTLLAVLVKDETLDLDDRLEKTSALHGALASLTFRVLRDRYADTKHVDELKENRNLIDFLASLAVGTVYEVRNDAASLLPTRSIENERLFGAVERGRREELGKQLIALYQKFAAEHLPLVDDPHASGLVRQDFLNFVQKMMLQIKQSRLHSQIAATGVYAAMTYLAVFHPAIDAIGIVEGGRSENSLVASSAIYFTFWSTIFVTKGLTITNKSVAMLKDLRRLLEDPNATISKPNMFDRFKTRFWRLEGEKKPVKDANTKSFMARACDAFGSKK